MLICAICALGVLLSAPNLFSPAFLAQLPDIAAAQAGSARARPARRLVSVARGRCRGGAARAPQLDHRQCPQRAARRQYRLYRPRRKRRCDRVRDPRAGTDRRCAPGAGQDRSRPDRRYRARRSRDGRLQCGRDRSEAAPRRRPVDRDHPPPHRRDRDQGADDRARGRRPHPGATTRHLRSRARQGTAGAYREADLSARRHRRFAGRRAQRPAAARR